MLETFRLSDVSGRKPHEVSGGQRQRCSIARSLIVTPKVLLLDEPAQGLDAPLRAELYDVLRQVRAEFKTPMLLVTHDLDECFELGEEMLILRDGKIAQSGPPHAILDQPANADVARLLGAFNLIPCEIRALDPGRNTSRVQVGDYELDGPYFPGRFKGDRVTMCVRPEQLMVSARLGKAGPNQIPAELKRVVERSQWMRLEFEGGILADMLRADYEKQRDNKEWWIEFPPSSLRVL
jgi:ABC-type sulfate/molybdate transport systems ATPase subunit